MSQNAAARCDPRIGGSRCRQLYGSPEKVLQVQGAGDLKKAGDCVITTESKTEKNCRTEKVTVDKIRTDTGNQFTNTAHPRGQRPRAADGQIRGSNMYYCTAVYPFLDGPALGARDCNVDFHAEFHELGSLRRCPTGTVGGLYDV